MGNVVLLNGPSSSAKTFVAPRLQARFADAYFYLALDTFVRSTDRHEIAIDLVYYDRLFVPALHRICALYAAQGANVILDHCLVRNAWFEDASAQLSGRRVYFVGLFCPREELERREAARGDRPAGLARSQLDAVHQHGEYDIQVDTSQQSVEECAILIHDFVMSHEPARFVS